MNKKLYFVIFVMVFMWGLIAYIWKLNVDAGVDYNDRYSFLNWGKSHASANDSPERYLSDSEIIRYFKRFKTCDANVYWPTWSLDNIQCKRMLSTTRFMTDEEIKKMTTNYIRCHLVPSELLVDTKRCRDKYNKVEEKALVAKHNAAKEAAQIAGVKAYEEELAAKALIPDAKYIRMAKALVKRYENPLKTTLSKIPEDTHKDIIESLKIKADNEPDLFKQTVFREISAIIENYNIQ